MRPRGRSFTAAVRFDLITRGIGWKRLVYLITLSFCPIAFRWLRGITAIAQTTQIFINLPPACCLFKTISLVFILFVRQRQRSSAPNSAGQRMRLLGYHYIEMHSLLTVRRLTSFTHLWLFYLEVELQAHSITIIHYVITPTGMQR